MKQRRKRSYSSDLSKTQWRVIKPLLPPIHGNQTVSLRRIVNAIFYLTVTGCQWRNFPHDYPASSTVYYHFAKRSADGTLEKINATLCELDRLKRGREKTPSAALVAG